MTFLWFLQKNGTRKLRLRNRSFHRINFIVSSCFPVLVLIILIIGLACFYGNYTQAKESDLLHYTDK